MAATFVTHVRLCNSDLYDARSASKNQPDGGDFDSDLYDSFSASKNQLDGGDFDSNLCDARSASKNQPDSGEMAQLLATLEECLEALGILRDTQGRSLAAPVAAGVSRGGQGAATVRYHCVKCRMPRDS